MKIRLLTLILLFCMSYTVVAQTSTTNPPSSVLPFPPGYNKNVKGNADYLRTLNRNATYGSIDGAFFNPAGLIGLRDGYYVHVGNQIDIMGIPLPKADEIMTTAWGLNPDFAFVWKQAGYGLFFNVHSPKILFFKQRNTNFLNPGTGSPTVTSYDRIYFQYTLESVYGGMFGIGDHFSTSAGLRLVWQYNKDDLSITQPGNLTTKREHFVDYLRGTGFGGQAGIMLKWSWFNASLNYLSPVSLSLKNKHLQTAIEGAFGSGKKPSEVMGIGQDPSNEVYHVPGELRVGLEFDIAHKVRLQASFDFLFDKEKEFGSGFMFEGNRANTMHFGVGAEHIISDRVMWGSGVSYTVGTNESGLKIGLGGVFNVGDVVQIKPSFMVPLSFDDFADKKFDFHMNLAVTIFVDPYRKSNPR